MSETSNRKALIEQLLSDRDAEFRRAVKAGRQLKELSDVKRMQADYEAGPAEKDKAIQERDRALGSKENQIAQLEQKLLYLERKMWGAMSEKRRIPDDPNQLKLDFDLPEMTPEEEETVRKAVEEVTECRKVSVKEHEKRVPVRQKLPDNLRRVEEYIYPDGYPGHEDEWILFEDTETSEHLELQPAQLFRGLEAALSVGAAAPVIPADLRQHVQQPCRGGADALHGAQFFLAGLQHGGKVPEPLQQVICDLVGIPLSIGRIQDIFQNFMVGQTVQPVVLHPLPHALAVPLMPFVFCHGGSPFQRSFFIVPISGTELKPPGKIFRAGCVDLAGFVY